jgi:eukaryotic-like serine/threonine-protein kinase
MAETDDTTLVQPEPRIGSYRLVQQLGSGGMSSVFRAIHVDTGHEVAVKILPRYLAKNATLLQRFLREAKTAEALEHPNIVAIFDRGSESGRYYLVLEFVPGGDLHDRIRNVGPLSAQELIHVLKAICEGLRYAAGKGLIHRDIKPANLLMTPDGKVKVTDLGLALQVEDEDERVTRDGTTVGTVDYMSPEQARDSRATSIRSDIYSLGCTAYYLLTGSPPYQGGDVAEKLRRHAQAVPPDVRAVRPEIPEALAKLIQKMMAKRPEARFADYEELLKALELEPAGEGPGELLYAIIDDEDDSAAPDYSVGAADLLALDQPPTTIESRSTDRPPAGPPRISALAGIPEDFSLVELAALDDAPPALTRPKPEPSILGLEPRRPYQDELLPVTRPTPRVRATSDDSVKTYIVRGLAVGIVVVMIGVGLQQLLALSSSPATPRSTTSGDDVSPKAIEPLRETAAPKPEKKSPKRPETTPAKSTKLATQPPRWMEPDETEPDAVIEETRLAPAVEAKFFPDGGGGDEVIPSRLPGPLVTVRRLKTKNAADHVESLAQAFEKPGGTVEIADDGPFFETDLRSSTSSRLVRATPGFRPIVVLEAPTTDALRAQPAVFVLENEKFYLDGLDLVVRMKDRPATQHSLFLLRGSSELRLENCTITVEDPQNRPFTLVQIGTPNVDRMSSSPRPPRVRISRSLARGSALTAVRFAAGSAEVVVVRSVLLCGNAHPVEDDGAAPARSRGLYLARSLVASQRSFLDTVGSAVLARALLSTFAHIDGVGASPLVTVRDANLGSPTQALDWLGNGNQFTGWSSFLGAGSGRQLKLTQFASLKSLWPGSDASSQQTNRSWAQSCLADESCLPQLSRLAAERVATLNAVAKPSPHLWAKAIHHFSRQRVPASVRPIGKSPPTIVQQIPSQDPKNSDAAPSEVDVENDPKRSIRTLSFDASSPEWNGDLGHFLQKAAPDLKTGSHVQVKVKGSGNHPLTPVRLPVGVALEVHVVRGESGSEPLTWNPARGAAGEALFHVQHADLVLENVRITSDGPIKGLKRFLRADDGHLSLVDCRLSALGSGPGGGIDLILIRAVGTKDLESARPPAAPQPDRPMASFSNCLFQTTGVVVTAELGRGIVALRNCVVVGGSAAFDLRPQLVRRDRFEADLWLDRCTVTSEYDFVRLGRWPGKAPGPDRPWLVSSNKCAFVDRYERPRNTTVLFRADPEAIAQGALTWQASGDSYDLAHFTGATNLPPSTDLGPDVKHQWIDLWGPNHIDKSVTGPTLQGGRASVRLANNPLHPGAIAPGDLRLEWTNATSESPPRATRAVDIGADLELFPTGVVQKSAPGTEVSPE